MNRQTLLLVALAGANAWGGEAAIAQNSDKERATRLVVRIDSWGPSLEGGRQYGSGFIIAWDTDFIWVATARHVVAGEVDLKWTLADSARVTFSDSANSRVDSFILPDSAFAWYDVAAVRVPRRGNRDLANWTPPVLDRLGNVHRLRFGDEVNPMGCPRGDCWKVPTPSDRVVTYLPRLLAFQSTFIFDGSSGGALFNRWWEIVGMVTEQGEVPRANAIPADEVVDVLKRSGVHVRLGHPRLPRDGYHVAFDATVLTSRGGDRAPDSISVGRRLPSVLLTLSRRGNGMLTWHLGVSHLAPFNTEVLSVMGGIGATLRPSDFLSLRPFLELGASKVKSRHDAGGYFASPKDAATGARKYVPLWVVERASGANFGAGMGIEFILFPHVSMAATFAAWSPPETLSGPSFPAIFYGIGLRWSR